MLVLGHFNIHVDCSLSTGLADVLDIFGLQQHVVFDSHNKGHTLDLVCTTDVEFSKLEGNVSGMSDHKRITFTLAIPLPTRPNKHSI